MRRQAVARTAPPDPQARELVSCAATCRWQALVIDGLTLALWHLRRGASALKGANAELRVALVRIRQLTGAR